VIQWARSKDLWWRRAACVATVPLNHPGRGGTGDTRRTLKILELVAHEREPMIAKAVSWALRSMVGTDPNAGRKFLKDQDARLPALVKREVTRKLTTGLKNPRRKKRAD